LLPGDVEDVRRKEKEELLAGRVASLKDVVEVKFEKDDGKWVCPVTRKELGASIKAVYLVPCGHAFSEVAVRETETAGEKACSVCGQPYDGGVVNILPLEKSVLEALEERIAGLRERGLSHSLKKDKSLKKKKAKKEKDNGAEEMARILADGSLDDKEKLKLLEELSKRKSKTETKADDENSETLDSERKRKFVATDILPAAKFAKITSQPASRSGTSTPVPTGIKNAATASLTAKVLEEQEEKNRRRKAGLNDNLKSLFTSGPRVGHSGDFMTRGFTVPDRR
jgi:hypothetical protein